MSIFLQIKKVPHGGHSGRLLVACALLLKDGGGDTAALGQGHKGLAIGSGDREDVLESGGERVVVRILDGDNVERTGVALDADEGSVTSTVLT